MRTNRGRGRGALSKKKLLAAKKRPSLRFPPPDGWSLGYIRKLKPLPGRGNSVFLAEIQPSGERFVLKKLEKDRGLYPASSSAQLERELHLTMKHANVIETISSFETESSIYLMMEYAECGDLFDAIVRPDHNEYRASRYLYDVVLGVQYIHEQRIIHRDVKAENIVVTANGRCKLIDFGFATRLKEGHRYLNDQLIAGTIDYLSPEVIHKRPYNQSIDIWAIGVLAYILLCKHVPFAPHSSQLESTFAKRSIVTKAILAIDVYRGKPYQAVSSVAKDFLARTLVRNPEKRMTLDEMLIHPFLSQTESFDSACFPGSGSHSRQGSESSSSSGATCSTCSDESGESSSRNSSASANLFVEEGESDDADGVPPKSASFRHQHKGSTSAEGSSTACYREGTSHARAVRSVSNASAHRSTRSGGHSRNSSRGSVGVPPAAVGMISRSDDLPPGLSGLVCYPEVGGRSSVAGSQFENSSVINRSQSPPLFTHQQNSMHLMARMEEEFSLVNLDESTPTTTEKDDEHYDNDSINTDKTCS